MVVPVSHLLSQGPVIAALGRVALRAVAPRRAGRAEVPGPWVEGELPPRPEGLVRDYLRHVGGDPASYPGRLPPHLFPQWSFPLLARTLEGQPYPLVRAVNAGCRLEPRAPLPAGEPLLVRARLERVDDDGRRVLFTQRVIAGTRSAPDALSAEVRARVPLTRPPPTRPERGERRAPPAVPEDAEAIDALDLPARAGLDFALLTGDVNPIHWLGPWARASGFGAPILHGFAALARAFEALARARLGGDPRRLRALDVRFVRPLALPARAGVFTRGGEAGGDVWIGERPGGLAHLEGTFESHDRPEDAGRAREPK